LAQLPFTAAPAEVEQAWQVPSHAVSQHTPSTHWPPAHWLGPVQLLPRGRLETHVPPLQKVPALHWASDAQAVRQVGPPLQKLTPHSEEGSVPAGSGRQRPALVGRLQAWQVPSHADSQQVPSTHWPEAHWLAPAQAADWGSLGVQVPALQKAPAAHAASLVHWAGQLPPCPEQTYAPHAGRPALPSGAGVQVPSEPGESHRSQAPVQAVLQQRPSAQAPEAQASSVRQAEPG
jgi:hypothetical protein